MLLFRSLTLGLLGACVVLLARVQPVVVVRGAHAPAMASVQVPASTATIVDIAPGVVDVAAMIRLAPGERVISVDDQPVPTDLVAGALIAASPRGRGRYLDLDVASATTSRRVLVLMH
jgi:hypothetical protein